MVMPESFVISNQNMFAGKSELSREGKAGVGQHLRARKIRRAYPAERGKWNRCTIVTSVATTANTNANTITPQPPTYYPYFHEFICVDILYPFTLDSTTIENITPPTPNPPE
uniref:Uncharacterized protein n=1 Tax=Vespula pensylvanica TaxID=30213 RepID=A0A834U8F0_VESPE|nr:hypothetical protein H0235_009609 [Vespula pensylvanica]